MKHIFSLVIILVFSCCSKDSETDSSNTYGLSQDDIDKAMTIHNNARSDVDLEDLKWSNTLAADAYVWAKQMAKKDEMYHSQNNERTGQGENLYYSSNTDSITPASNASRLWYEEINLYTYSPIGSGLNEFSQIGHYTQMVWYNTTEIGIAMAVSSSGKTYVTARYSPAGNYVGQTPY